jgi:hypothetical protein
VLQEVYERNWIDTQMYYHATPRGSMYAIRKSRHDWNRNLDKEEQEQEQKQNNAILCQTLPETQKKNSLLKRSKDKTMDNYRHGQ